MARRILIGLTVILVWPGVAPAWGDTRDSNFDYDIFRLSDTLAVWLDVTPVMTQTRMEDLLAGLDISIAVECAVEKPRPVLPAKTILKSTTVIMLSHPLAEDIYRLSLSNGSVKTREFESQLALSDFLADSLVFRVAPSERIRPEGEVRLRLSLISKSQSPNMMDEGVRPPKDRLRTPETPRTVFESAFSLFLDLVGFGQAAYRIVTPPFAVDGLDSF
jgi:hypothetical protein